MNCTVQQPYDFFVSGRVRTHVRWPHPFMALPCTSGKGRLAPRSFSYYIGRDVPIVKRKANLEKLSKLLESTASKSAAVLVVAVGPTGSHTVKRHATLDEFAESADFPAPLIGVLTTPVGVNAGTPAAVPTPPPSMTHDVVVQSNYLVSIVDIHHSLDGASAKKILEVLLNNLSNLGGRDNLFRFGKNESLFSSATLELHGAHRQLVFIYVQQCQRVCTI